MKNSQISVSGADFLLCLFYQNGDIEVFRRNWTDFVPPEIVKQRKHLDLFPAAMELLCDDFLEIAKTRKLSVGGDENDCSGLCEILAHTINDAMENE